MQKIAIPSLSQNTATDQEIHSGIIAIIGAARGPAALAILKLFEEVNT